MRFLQTLVLLGLALGTSSCIIHVDENGWFTSWGDASGPRIDGNGVLGEETRNLKGFDQISLHGSPDVRVLVGEEGPVTVRGDQNLLEHVITEVKDSRLIVRMERGSYYYSNPIEVQVPMAALVGFSIAGSGDAKIHGVDSDELGLAISGSGDITAHGYVRELDAAISGSGEMNLLGLSAQIASIAISGSGDIRADVSTELNAVISGSGSVRYHGSPETNTAVLGSGSIRRAND